MPPDMSPVPPREGSVHTPPQLRTSGTKPERLDQKQAYNTSQETHHEALNPSPANHSTKSFPASLQAPHGTQLYEHEDPKPELRRSPPHQVKHELGGLNVVNQVSDYKSLRDELS